MLKEIPKSSNKKSDKQLGTTDMSESEKKESAEQNKKQTRVGIKILTPDQMLSRLPITLVQSKAGDIFLYCLYRSKKLTKQLYKSLVEII